MMSEPTRRWPERLAAVAFVLTFASAVQAQISIGSSMTLTTGNGPDGVAIGDFTGDGFPDIATSADDPDRIQLLVGNGIGSYVLGTSFLIGSGTGAGDLAAYDADGDGDLDLAVCRTNLSDVLVLRNNGFGEFSTIGAYHTGEESVGITAGDMDNDGDIDLVVANRAEDTVSVLRRETIGYSVTSFDVAGEPRGVAFLNIDGDSDLDLAVGSHDDRLIEIYTNSANTFTASMTLDMNGVARPDGLAAGDLNGDGLVDIAAAANAGVTGGVVIFRGIAGGFATPVSYSSGGAGATWIKLGDLECDGDLDIAVVNVDSNSVGLLGNNGDGTFLAPVMAATDIDPSGLAIGNADTDTDLDVAVPNTTSNTITITLMGCGTGGGGGIVCGDLVCEPGENPNCIDCILAGGNPGPEGSYSFAASSLLAGANPDGIAAIDFDDDGDNDLAVAVDAPDVIQLLVNDGSGHFELGPTVELASSASPGALIAGDLDGDGDADMAIVYKQTQLIAFFANVLGTFTAAGSVSVGINPRDMIAADVDGNGTLDLAVVNRDSNTATFVRNSGAFSFVTQTIATGVDPRGITFGEWSPARGLELAVASHDDRSISLFSLSRGGYVAAGSVLLNDQIRPDGLTSGDLNGDGQSELVAATNGDVPGLDSINVLFAGPKGFEISKIYKTDGADTSKVILADLDCDGDLDAITRNTDSNDLSILANSGTGVYGPATLVPVGTSPETLIAAELNGDTTLDLAVTNALSNDVTLLLNESCMPPANPADLNGDGVVNAVDLAILIGAWGGAGLGDINGDGTTDAVDLALLIGSWS
ncbi:MAG: VCBS repeat-containing protein [Phycisphaerae bacterium]|jgi:hypothetical protein|nr:VCBS repeat-containing protein [Phycisphaerae bacterium]